MCVSVTKHLNLEPKFLTFSLLADVSLHTYLWDMDMASIGYQL